MYRRRILTPILQCHSSRTIGVQHVEVRSTVTNRFIANGHFDAIYERFRGRPFNMVLAWFERHPERDLFEEFKSLLLTRDHRVPDIEVLEVGEVIHHTPVYAIFACENISDYVAFFRRHQLKQTTCHSYISHVEKDVDAQLRYSLLSGLYLPPRS